MISVMVGLDLGWVFAFSSISAVPRYVNPPAHIASTLPAATPSCLRFTLYLYDIQRFLSLE